MDAEVIVEGRGTTVEEAVGRALAELGLPAEQAEVEIVAEGVRALPGERMGGGSAHVRVRPLDEEARAAKGLLQELLERMGVAALVTAHRAPAPGGAGTGPIVLDVSGDDLGLLIGWRGETLRALQTVVNLMMGVEEGSGRPVLVDVERYRARREDQVRDLALRLAERVKRSGQRYVLEPMRPFERRVVHLALDGEEGVRTESMGKEPARRVVIHPTGPAREGGEGAWRRGGGSRSSSSSRGGGWSPRR